MFMFMSYLSCYLHANPTGKLSDHISKLDDLRFDLMRMYKHKPNNRFCLCGATDAIGKMTWREFLHLPADETDHELLPV